jgi:2-enoate reductase
MVSYPKLFEPISIGKVTIKNRIAMAPMGIVGLTNPDGNPGPRAIDYYIERARGGTGLIITGLFNVSDEFRMGAAECTILTFYHADLSERCARPSTPWGQKYSCR